MTLSLPICAYMISKKIDGCVFVSTEDYLQLQHLKRKKKEKKKERDAVRRFCFSPTVGKTFQYIA